MPPLNFDKTKLGARLAKKKNLLEKLALHTLADMRRVAKDLPKLRKSGFNDQDIKVIKEFSDLARVFPPEIAIALHEAGAEGLATLKKWDTKSFDSALAKAGIDSGKVAYETTRLKRLKTLLASGKRTNTINGLTVDVGSSLRLAAQELSELRKAGVETLADWAAARDRARLRDGTVEALDAYARLSVIGVKKDLAPRLIRLNYSSALDLARLRNDELKNLARNLSVTEGDLRYYRENAIAWVNQVANLVTATQVNSPSAALGYLDDIFGGTDNCANCEDHLSAFSRFAYFVYLLQRTGKTLVELEKVFYQHFFALSPESGRDEIPQMQICIEVLSRARAAELTFAENSVYQRELMAGKLRLLPITFERLAEGLVDEASVAALANRLRAAVTAPMGSAQPVFTENEIVVLCDGLDTVLLPFFMEKQVRSEAQFADATSSQVWDEVTRRLDQAARATKAAAMPVLRDAYQRRTGKSNHELFEEFFIETDLPSCEKISRLDQAIRSLQAYLDHLRAIATTSNDIALVSYSSYEAWRVDRMMTVYPELRALWRDDVLVHERVSLDRGSVISDYSVNDPKIRADVNAVADILESVESVDDGEDPETFRLQHGVFYAEFQQGLQVIKELLEANRLGQSALAALDTDEPGLAIARLTQSAVHLDKLAELVFRPTSKWVTLGQGLALFDNLVGMSLAERRSTLEELFDELKAGEKRIFTPKNADLKVEGLASNGSFESLEEWTINPNLFSIEDGVVHKEFLDESGLARARYTGTDSGTFENYVVTVDATLPSGLKDKRVGLGIRLDADGDSGYRLMVERSVTHVDPGDDEGGFIDGLSDFLVGQDSSDIVRYWLTLERLDEASVTNLDGPWEISTIIYDPNSDMDPGQELLPWGDTFTLTLEVFGESVRGKLKVGNSTHEVSAEDDQYKKGTFMLAASKGVEVDFSNLRVDIEGADGKPPFYASRRVQRGHKISTTKYPWHKGTASAMSFSDLTPTRVLFPTDEDLEVELQGAIVDDQQVSLCFNDGGSAIELNQLDRLLERLISTSFYLRYAVIPVRLSQAYLRAGDYVRAARMLKIVYDDDGISEAQKEIYPYLAAAGEALAQTVGPDARLMRLRLGEAYLAQAERLFRRNTADSRYHARLLYERVLKLHTNNLECKCEEAIGTTIEQVVSVIVDWTVTTTETNEASEATAATLVATVGAFRGNVTDRGDLLKELEGIMPGPLPSPDLILKTIESSVRQTRTIISRVATVPALMIKGSEIIRAAELQAIALKNKPVITFSSVSQFAIQASPDSYTLYPGPNTIDYTFCIPWASLKSEQTRTACQMLHLLRTCRNILGFADDLVPPLRYSVLLQLARSFADLANAAERDLLSFRQQFELETFTILEAENTLAISDAQLNLERMNTELARGEISLAGLQLNQANAAATHFADLIDTGLLDSEQHALDYANAAVSFSALAAVPALVGVAIAIGGAASVPATGPVGGGVAAAGAIVAAAGGGLSSLAGAASAMSNASSMYATYERRKEDWQFQLQQSLTSVSIASQNLTQATTRFSIALQSQQIAGLRRDFSADAVQYLGNKFLNKAMWLIMLRLMREQYRRRLNYAITAAFMAERALAFELQNRQLRVIRFDYFDPTRDGLLGATQLQTDLMALENTRLSFTARKHQLTKTISLASMMPAEFEVFRSGGTLTSGEQVAAGLLRFRTLMDLFDRDHPGHYMRLIKSIKITVVALIPPNDGIHATLRSSGISHVVLGPPFEPTFRNETIRRTPESVALSVPLQATGLFVLDYKDDLLLPFEGSGVATDWVFELPKAANRFDFRTIADVLLTIEYTALESLTYRQQVIRRLGATASGERPFSFRRDFADCWYDLNHPELAESGKQLRVTFNTQRADFPPNVNDPRIAHVTLYFVRKQGFVAPIEVESLTLTPPKAPAFGGKPELNATSGLISTRTITDCPKWEPILGMEPTGEWELNLLKPGSDQAVIDKIKGWFNNGDIEDILFVITITGTAPAWPNP